jgi:spore coat polysaccharide biosynthesis protein SpsF
MEVGHFKIGAIIQARMGSSRLPNKILMPLPIKSSETIISTVIKNISKLKVIDKIVVATSKSPINDLLESTLIKYNVSCFRGEEEDVLSRFYSIVNIYKFDYVIRFTADNPIIDEIYLEEFISNFIKKDLNYSISKNLPLGCNFEMMRADEIISAFENSESEHDREHVTPYIRRNAVKIDEYYFKGIEHQQNLRLTIDYPSDYAFILILFLKLGKRKKTIKNINSIIADNSWLLDINKENFQKKEYLSLDEEINNILPIIKERELKRIENILIANVL